MSPCRLGSVSVSLFREVGCMNWDQLLELFKGLIGDNPMMLLLIGLAVYLLKSLFPAPESRADRVSRRFAERVRLASELGDDAAVERLAKKAASEVNAAVALEGRSVSAGILDWFKELFSGGNMMPLLLIGAVLMLFMFQGGGCGLKGGDKTGGPSDAAVSGSIGGGVGESGSWANDGSDSGLGVDRGFPSWGRESTGAGRAPAAGGVQHLDLRRSGDAWGGRGGVVDGSCVQEVGWRVVQGAPCCGRWGCGSSRPSVARTGAFVEVPRAERRGPVRVARGVLGRWIGRVRSWVGLDRRR